MVGRLCLWAWDMFTYILNVHEDEPAPLLAYLTYQPHEVDEPVPNYLTTDRDGWYNTDEVDEPEPNNDEGFNAFCFDLAMVMGMDGKVVPFDEG